MNNKISLTVYTTSHMVVDFSCFYVLMGMFSNTVKDLITISLGFLIYNIIAFGIQMFIGYFVDKHSIQHSKVAIIGCFIVLLGLLLAFSSLNLTPWMALVFCAFGNASFHIGGGINSLVYADGKMARGGIFVSSGAIGVALGTLAGKSLLPFWLPEIMLLACSLAIYVLCRSERGNYLHYNYDTTPKTGSFNRCISDKIIIYLCLISIIVRSFVGFEIPITWKTTTFLFILPSLCAFGGKFAGGILADKFGAKNVGVSSLLISIPFLCFFNNNIILCVVGLVLFNITMSITLWGVAMQLPNQLGFAFGLTTLALLVGNMPTFFFKLPEMLISIVLPIFIIISAICILYAIENKKRRGYYVKEIHDLSKKLSL